MWITTEKDVRFVPQSDLHYNGDSLVSPSLYSHSISRPDTRTLGRLIFLWYEVMTLLLSLLVTEFETWGMSPTRTLSTDFRQGDFSDTV